MLPILLDGDRVVEDNGESTIITSPKDKPPYNFGPASYRDTTVYTCERPGGDPKNSNEKMDPTEKVSEWFQYIQSQPPERQIQHVFILMSQKELDSAYMNPPGLIEAYQDIGIIVHHIPYPETKSYIKIMKQINEIHNRGEKAVAHCTHGVGRSGRVAAGWLVYKYGVTADDAVEETMAVARKERMERMGAPVQLRQWIEESSIN